MLLSLIFAIALAVIHLFAGKLQFLDTLPRSRWLSIAGGASVAYVFLHIFPELSEGQATIEALDSGIFNFLEHHIYLMSLLGFAIFYGLERLALRSRQKNRKTGKADTTSEEVFWLHVASFSIYNILIGYLMVHREEPGFASLFIFFITMGFHFIVNDYGLREHHKASYHRIGRWILATAILVGWGIGNATEISAAAIALLFAFLAGSIILNVLKEELPEERESRFWAFAAGVIGYSLLLLAL